MPKIQTVLILLLSALPPAQPGQAQAAKEKSENNKVKMKYFIKVDR